MAKIHFLRIEKECWEEKKAGNKRFEIRRNDREFKVGDVVYYYDANRILGVSKISCVEDFAQSRGYAVFGERILVINNKNGVQ